MQSKNTPKMSRVKLDSIQMLRGLAALFVLLYHIALEQINAVGRPPDVDSWLLHGPWIQGYAGVDLFFVISGFIMVYVTRAHDSTPNKGRKIAEVGAFLYRRIIRIYPLWWVFAGVLGLYYFLSKGIWAGPHLGLSAAESLDYFIKSMALVPLGKQPILVVGWTLVHELQFYLIFALLLFAPRRILPLLLAVWAAVNIAGFYAGLPKLGVLAALVFSPYSLEFIAGAVAALLIAKRLYIAPKTILIFGLLMLCVVVGFHLDNAVIKSPYRMFLYGVPFTAIIYGLTALEQQGRLSISRGLVILGDWSYSLYLSHMIVLIILSRVAREAAAYLPENIVSTFSLGAVGIVDNIAYSVAALILAIISAGMSFYMIERPLLRLARRRK